MVSSSDFQITLYMGTQWIYKLKFMEVGKKIIYVVGIYETLKITIGRLIEGVLIVLKS